MSDDLREQIQAVVVAGDRDWVDSVAELIARRERVLRERLARDIAALAAPCRCGHARTDHDGGGCLFSSCKCRKRGPATDNALLAEVLAVVRGVGEAKP